MPDIPAAWQQILQEIFTRLVPDFTVLAYGSRVNGSAHATSDLDLVLRHPKTPAIPCLHLSKVKAALRESNIPVSVDVQDWAQLPESFRQEIEQQHIVLFRSD
jgi:predicted nucleotidyltransferase